MPSVTGYALRLLNVLSLNPHTQRHRDIRYGEHPRQRIDLYRGKGRQPLPVVMFIHGGYWSDGERADYRFVGEALAQRGYLAAIISYRLYPEVRFPAFIDDAATALATLRRIAADYGGDPQRIFIGGHSAGAHSAVMLALDERYLAAAGGSPTWIRGFFGLSGPYDFLPPKEDKVAAIFGPSHNYPRGNPINFVAPSRPPALLVHGRDDRTVGARNSLRLAESLSAAGSDVELMISPGGHAAPLLAFSGIKRQRSQILDTLDRWIDQQLEAGLGCGHIPAEEVSSGA
ncbi:alpha/beta hydrolase [Spongiibacter sp.]|uniref:alpha/beta hydrolase n=1 Tax=Spongiibacter sp. TaxID=2024860 RepID=UPI0035653ECE